MVLLVAGAGEGKEQPGGARSWETSHLDVERQREKSEQTVGVNC